MKRLIRWGVGSRGFHIVSGGATLLGAAIVFSGFSSARSDVPTIIGVAGSAVTLFALFVALVEIVRLESTADAMQRSVSAVVMQLKREREAAATAECQSLIASAMRRCDEGEAVSLQDLTQLVRLYASVQLDGDLAAQRQSHVSMITSYSILSPQQRRNTNKLRDALISATAALELVAQETRENR